MTLDITPYLVHRVVIKRIFDNNENKDLETKIGTAAVATGIHIVAVSLICGQDVGYTDELLDIANRLKKFYKVTQVIGEDKLDRKVK